MSRLKPSWMKTDIPKHIKIGLWRLIKDNPTYPYWVRVVELGDWRGEEYADAELYYSRETFTRLKHEVLHMPVEEVTTLPEDLQVWISQVRENMQPPAKESEQIADYRLQWQQIEHLRSLQELARSVVDSFPELPNLDNLEEFDSFYSSLCRIYLWLVGDVRWPSLEAHLGDTAKDLKSMSFQLDPYVITPWEKGLPVPKDYQERANDGWVLLINSGLWLLSELGDTREWEYYGLNQRCPWCPDQMPEPLNG